MKVLHEAGLLFLYAVFFVVGLPALLTDFLFYRSDPFSMAVFVLAAALCLFPIFVIAGLAISRLPSQLSEWISRWAEFLVAATIIDLALVLSSLYFVSPSNVIPILTDLQHSFLPVAFSVLLVTICGIPAVLFIYLTSDRYGTILRVKQVGVLLFALAPVLVGYSIVTSMLERKASTQRHLVLIVLDGWPSQHMHAYNPQVPIGPLDQALTEGHTYRQAYTSTPWTSAFFGNLYNGSRQAAFGKATNMADKSLGASLQDHNVGVRFINFHRNGMPDASAARRSDHKGLRSYFLTPHYGWIPRYLGLDYHLALPVGAISQNLLWFAPRTLFEWLNPMHRDKTEKTNDLINILIPELKRLRVDHDRSFALFHKDWDGIGTGADVDLSDIPKAQNVGKPDGDWNAQVRADDYRYEPDLEPYATMVRQITRRRVYQQGTYIKDFIAAMRADPKLSDTVAVITADHGSIYAKGRFWYGFRPNREVIRVPFFVFDGEEGAISEQPFGTPELTAAVLDYFSEQPKSRGFHPERQTGFPIYSVTLRSDVQKEWFLVTSFPDRAWWMNIHPDGLGISREMSSDGYDQHEITQLKGPPPALAEDIEPAITAFGIDRKELHEEFRQ